MPHFSKAGNDEYICQVCGRVFDSVQFPPSWRPDITNSYDLGNVCPSCLYEARDEADATPENKPYAGEER